MQETIKKEKTTKYEVHTYFDLFKNGKLTCKEETTSIVEDFETAKKLFDHRTKDLFSRVNSVVDCSQIMAGAYVEIIEDAADPYNEGNRPLTLHIDIDY